MVTSTVPACNNNQSCTQLQYWNAIILSTGAVVITHDHAPLTPSRASPRQRSWWAIIHLACLVHSSSAASPPDAPSTPDLRARGLVLAKVYCLIAVFWATFAAGVSPYFFRWNASFLTLGTQYAGGVFLGTALIHFLSDSHNGFQKLTTKPYAFAELLAVSGYLLTMLGDLIIEWSSLDAQVPAPDKMRNIEPEKLGAGECAGGEVPEVKGASFGDALILVLALCFHSVFEGIAIGVAETEQDAWKALWTISLHKVFAAVAMGVALQRLLPNRALLSCFTYALVFAVSTPVGVAVGIVVDAAAPGAVVDWVYAVSMGTASGVFVYVAIHHLLTCSPSRTVLPRVVAVASGAATIAVVMVWDTQM